MQKWELRGKIWCWALSIEGLYNILAVAAHRHLERRQDAGKSTLWQQQYLAQVAIWYPPLYCIETFFKPIDGLFEKRR